MKILFLDMDGVVNATYIVDEWIKIHGDSNESKKAFREHYKNGIVPELAQRVCDIVSQTSCKIVWSSTWRRQRFLERIANAKLSFNSWGLPGDSLIDKTPYFPGSPRAYEIDEWIKENTEKYNIERCAIVDDDSDAGLIENENRKFFWTSMKTGLTEELKKHIIEYLNTGKCCYHYLDN